MKVVLFCGGQGLRIRDLSESLPKPLVEIGYRPILWNLMRYYAHYGHKDFVLCLGYKADAIKSYFLNYDESLTNDFVLRQGGAQIELLARDIDDWTMTFVDTGLDSNIGERLVAVKEYVQDEACFLANYADALTDLDLDRYIQRFHEHGRVAQMLTVAFPSALHVVSADDDGYVGSIEQVTKAQVVVNGGFFVFRPEVFEYIEEGEELVEEPFQRLLKQRELVAVRYEGFWQNMDTFKDKQRFDDMAASGRTPWRVWDPRTKGDGEGRPG